MAASFVPEILFTQRSGGFPSPPTYRAFRDKADMNYNSHMDDAARSTTFIHTGPSPSQPPPPSCSLSFARNETVGDYPSLGFIPSAFVADTDGGANGGGQSTNRRELIRCGVVNDRDSQRGFRLFDGILMGVKDVSSEELFLERMRIVYAIYDTHVAGHADRSPLDVAKALVRALSACLTKYFSTQSMLRTNRPFIAKVLHLDSPDMFCTHSDFVQSFLFTNASAEDDLLISLAEKIYAENEFDVCNGDYSGGDGARQASSDRPTSDQLFDAINRIAERHVVGGSQPSFAARNDFTTTATTAPEHYYGAATGPSSRVPGGGSNSTTTTAMLIVVTDFEALHDYVAYVMYLTPAQLSRRYNLNFDCLRRPRGGGGTAYDGANADCCRERDSRKRKRDSAKAAIRTVIERRRREKIDSMKARGAACEAVRHQQTVQMLERNNDLLCHLLLMLFDKCLSSLLDRGFENLNARRGYAMASAKEIGAATVYTGIIDTVGEVSTVLEGCTFDGLVAARTINDDSGGDRESDQERRLEQHRLHFSLPIQTIVSQTTNQKHNRRTQATDLDGQDESAF